jgi:CPA2 family monovalent cation:H+ antiporter-2
LSGHVVIVGFGPAGQRVAEGLQTLGASRLVVVELNSRTAARARSFDLYTCVGDATHSEVLEHVSVQTAASVVVTVPDPAAARQVVARVRALAPETPIIARARYQAHRQDLFKAGAVVAVDEEDGVGLRLAAVARETLGLSPTSTNPHGDATDMFQ